MVFLDFEVWVKDFKVFDLRFGFLVKNCICSHLGPNPDPERNLVFAYQMGRV